MFDHVFSPITIKGHTIKNRFTVPAMVSNFCNEDGTATERYIAYHEAKAKGGWGLIITEDYNVAPEGHGFSCTAGLWNDGQIESHSELPKRVHQYGATILAQIYHCGRQTASDRIPEGCHTRSSSAILCPFGDQIPIPFTTEEVKDMVSKYGDTALRAKKCGFDGVEIHGAHGYLITQFFSPYSNKRLDEYGGNFWNRTRFAREIIADVRKKCGDDFIIDMRISADEFVEGGLTIEDSKAIAVMMEEAGLDMIHVSVGNYLSVDLNIASSYSGHGWFTDWAKQVKDVVKIPVVTVSRINDPFLADEILASGKADFVAMGRASLCDPGLPNKAKEGHFEDIRRCIGCNDGCEGVLFENKPFTCVLNPELGHEYEGGIKPADTPLKVAIAGAGPAGLYAAIAAARRGHKVTVFEKNDHTGGNFYTASIPPTKGEITDFLVWQRVQCEKLGVEIKYNTPATAAVIKEGGFDKVIVASGSHPAMPPIPGLKEVSKVTNAQEILEGRVFPGQKCVVIGGGQVGAETAHFLAQLLRDVTILEMLPEIAKDAALAVNWHLKESLEKRKVAIHTSVKVLEIKEEGVLYETAEGQQILAPADTICVATGYRSNEELKQELDEAGIAYTAVGDAIRARKVTAATHEGYEAGKNL
ncbi:MAG: FAD-dependent oxidoreductase [Lachnospiraceae bacterium]|nr:FAD-dependent oxidoreductase [Lachnospiraceae bacterium]